MPEITRKKTIDYLRVTWVEPQTETLEDLLRQALGSFSKTSESIFDRGDGTYEATLHWNLGEEAVFLDFVGFQLGEETSVVPTLEKIAEGRVDLETQKASDGLEFLDTEVMMRVSGDHCLIMTHLARAGRAKTALRNLLTRAGLKDEDTRFDLMPVGNPEFRELLDEPVKSVGFNFGFSAAAADKTITEKRGATLTGQMREMVLGLFRDTSDGEAEWGEAENLQVRVTVSYNGRMKVEGRLGVDGAERVAELAKRVNEDEDEEGYTINFKNGSRFTATQIKVRKEVEIPAFGKTVFHTRRLDGDEYLLGRVEGRRHY